jgi:hypothetical protein
MFGCREVLVRINLVVIGSALLAVAAAAGLILLMMA